MHEFYIHSELDDSAIRIVSKVPDGYDGKQAYPVVLGLSTANEGCICWLADLEKQLEDCLVFDVTGRGFTGGSYIGEASTWEIIRWIFENFTIDRERVYVAGHSNGGFATWAIAQYHPDFAAAVYPLTGYPAIADIENTTNIPAYQLVSPKDHVFIGRTNEVKNRLKHYGNYTQYDFREMLHTHFGFYLLHPVIFNAMKQSRRNLWPKNILYRTTRNRHLESFWIRLHGIARGKQYAKINAEIAGPSVINVRLQNADGMTVTLPPQVEKDAFTVCVNGQVIPFERYEKPRVILKKEKGKWNIADSEPAVDYRKGTGLLDIYMNSLRIIVPDGCTEALTKTASNFAKPYTSGALPEVYTKYPIYEAAGVPNYIFGHNLLLLETYGHPNSFIRRFEGKFPVRCDETGYTYNGVRADGNYVVMQVVPNPYDPHRTFLMISANDEALLKKHILLRKVVLPTYVNGLHPLWNNEILVFDGKSYCAAYEVGYELVQVTHTGGGERK